MRLRTLGTSVAFFLQFSMMSAFPFSAQEEPRWGYEGKGAPANWSKLDPANATCAAGKRQSPIDIKGAQISALPALQFEYHSAPLNIIDNGRTIEVNYAAGSTPARAGLQAAVATARSAEPAG